MDRKSSSKSSGSIGSDRSVESGSRKSSVYADHNLSGVNAANRRLNNSRHSLGSRGSDIWLEDVLISPDIDCYR